jgi:hypothetical protein
MPQMTVAAIPEVILATSKARHLPKVRLFGRKKVVLVRSRKVQEAHARSFQIREVARGRSHKVAVRGALVAVKVAAGAVVAARLQN